MTGDRFSVLIVDDEPLARRTLRDFLDGVDWVGERREAADGEAAITAIDGWQPDLVFLDIVLPGSSGLDVLARTTHRPHVVFTTAFDSYAVTAFELGALDYLLKPFARGRFELVLDRARAALASEGRTAIDRARMLLGWDGRISRVFVRDGPRVVGLDLAAVESIDGGDDHAVFHSGGREYLVRARLRDVEAKLDAARFARIHRSHLVNLECIAAFAPYDAWRLEVILKSGRRIVASRAGSRLLKGLVLG
jgi:two-component system LytT family response regulator